MTRIRSASQHDSETIRQLHLCAFPDTENRAVSALAVALLRLAPQQGVINLVAECDQELIGHAAFSPLVIPDTTGWQGYILGPLGVRPSQQRQLIGTRLIRQGIALLDQRGVNTLLVYGDPRYYGRFGFDATTAASFSPPYALAYPFGWLGLTLHQYDQPIPATSLICVDPLMDPQYW